MSGDLIRLVDSIHRDKGIPQDEILEGIRNALDMAARKHFPDSEIEIQIDPETGQIHFQRDGVVEDPTVLGRISAQTAKQVMIQRFRESERDTLYSEFEGQIGELVTGTVQRFERGAVTVDLNRTYALLPRSEQIPGESYHQGERVRAVIREVRKQGQRVKIILSRTHPDFVRRLFELEIPEIAEQVIAIRALAREAGYRSKVAVSSIDTKVDAVGACVGVRGTRIKNIVDELNGERIDIVRWNESLQVLIPNALQPAEIEEVMLCALLGRAIVLVREDQLSLAIGRRGQNVRLASKLVGWDIEIMTSDELNEAIEKAIALFVRMDGLSQPVEEELAERLVEQGILSYDDLSIMEIDDLLNTIDGFTEEHAIEIVTRAEQLAEEQEADGESRSTRLGASTREAAPLPDLSENAETAPAETDESGNPVEAESTIDVADAADPEAPVTADSEPTSLDPSNEANGDYGPEDVRDEAADASLESEADPDRPTDPQVDSAQPELDREGEENQDSFASGPTGLSDESSLSWNDPDLEDSLVTDDGVAPGSGLNGADEAPNADSDDPDRSVNLERDPSEAATARSETHLESLPDDSSESMGHDPRRTDTDMDTP